ncbi:MAG: hypothetical protein NC131_05785 [Roseburia sp.]|nr:hypothetical protein [Roseburia sp.]
MKSEKKKLSPKAKKIINIVVDVVCGAILILALVLAISMISSKRKNYGNYTEVFGKAYLAVASPSMEKDYETGEKGAGNFSQGDLITVKILKDNKAQSSLKVGDVITFNDNTIVEGKYVLNTHRIQSISKVNDGSYIFVTHGDNNPAHVTETVYSKDVVGVLVGVKSGGGSVVSFMGSSTGFFVFVVLPTLIIVAIAAVNLVMVILREKKAQTEVAEKAQQEVLADERERIRQELLAEMQANGKPEPAEQPAETAAEEAEQPDGQPAERAVKPEPAESAEEVSEQSDEKEEK